MNYLTYCFYTGECGWLTKLVRIKGWIWSHIFSPQCLEWWSDVSWPITVHYMRWWLKCRNFALCGSLLQSLKCTTRELSLHLICFCHMLLHLVDMFIFQVDFVVIVQILYNTSKEDAESKAKNWISWTLFLLMQCKCANCTLELLVQ